jgi:hypothetical protein
MMTVSGNIVLICCVARMPFIFGMLISITTNLVWIYLHRFNYLHTVARFPNHFHIITLLNDAPETLSEDRMIID